MLILLFLVLVVITFSIVLVVTRPTKEETEIGRRLAGYNRGSGANQVVDADILKHESYSEFPLINALLSRMKVAVNVDTLIKQANSDWTVGRLIFGALAIFFIVAGMTGVYFHNVWAGVVIGLLAGNGPYIYLVMKRRARLSKFEAILPDAIDLLGRAMRAGHAVTAAIEMVAKEIPDPVGMEFRRVFEEQTFGLPIREALLNLARRVPVPDLQFLVTAMLVQKETGGNLAEILDKAGVVIRERSRLMGQLRIYTAQGRLTGWILGLLPFIIFAAMSFVNRNYARSLIDDPMGRKAIWIGLGLMVIGVYFIRKIVDIKV